MIYPASVGERHEGISENQAHAQARSVRGIERRHGSARAGARALFAVYLRTNIRTLENWEQGRAKPNAQAALLINLVKQYPDTVQRLAAI